MKLSLFLFCCTALLVLTAHARPWSPADPLFGQLQRLQQQLFKKSHIQILPRKVTRFEGPRQAYAAGDDEDEYYDEEEEEDEELEDELQTTLAEDVVGNHGNGEGTTGEQNDDVDEADDDDDDDDGEGEDDADDEY